MFFCACVIVCVFWMFVSVVNVFEYSLYLWFNQRLMVTGVLASQAAVTVPANAPKMEIPGLMHVFVTPTAERAERVSGGVRGAGARLYGPGSGDCYE
jgi:hypothetical protein